MRCLTIGSGVPSGPGAAIDGDEDDAIAGLLHDAVEDQGGQPTLDAIRSRFGNRVADIVEACSDTDMWPKPPWRQRKERYIEHLGTAPPSGQAVQALDLRWSDFGRASRWNIC